jgi:hypothetical protein
LIYRFFNDAFPSSEILNPNEQEDDRQGLERGLCGLFQGGLPAILMQRMGDSTKGVSY